MKTSNTTIDLNKKITVTFHDNNENNTGVTMIINNNVPVRMTRDLGSKETILNSGLLNTRALQKSAAAFVKETDFENYIVMKNDYTIAFVGVTTDMTNSMVRIGTMKTSRIKYVTLAMNSSSSNSTGQTMHYYGEQMTSTFKTQVKESCETIEKSTSKIEQANNVINEEIIALKEEIARLKAAVNRPAAERFVEAAKELKENNVTKEMFISVINESFETKTEETKPEVSDVVVFIANKSVVKNQVINQSMAEARDFKHLEEICARGTNIALYHLPEVFEIKGTDSKVIHVNQNTKELIKL